MTTYVGAADSVGDAVDNNCDGVDGVDMDQDGHASTQSAGSDCDDFRELIHPDAVDNVGDSVDNNCDGIDGTDSDADGHASVSSGGDDCNDIDSGIHPGADDPNFNGIDHDCDGFDGTWVMWTATVISQLSLAVMIAMTTTRQFISVHKRFSLMVKTKIVMLLMMYASRKLSKVALGSAR